LAYKVVYKKSVLRDLKKLSKVDAIRILDHIEIELAINPETNPVLKGNFSGLRKYRIGDFRIIYALIDDDILILKIGHRKDIHKRDI